MTYLYIYQGNIEGPYSLEEMRVRYARKIIVPTTQICLNGSPDWHPASNFPEIEVSEVVEPHGASSQPSLKQPAIVRCFYYIYRALRLLFLLVAGFWLMMVILVISTAEPGESLKGNDSGALIGILLSLGIPAFGAWMAWVIMEKTKLQVAMLEELRSNRK